MSEKIKGQLHDSQDDLYARWVQAGRPVNAPEKQEKDGLVSSEYLFTQTRERSIGVAAVRAASGFMEERKAKKEEAERNRGAETITRLREAIAERDAEVEKRKEVEAQLAEANAKLEAIQKLLNGGQSLVSSGAEPITADEVPKSHDQLLDEFKSMATRAQEKPVITADKVPRVDTNKYPPSE